MSFIQRRRSLRLHGYDYSKAGAYFITICTGDRECHLGEILDGSIRLTEVGEVVNKYWLNIPMHFENMKIDAHIVMPNHIHGIIIIHDKADVVGVQNSKPLRHKANLVGVQHPELPQHKANLVGVQNFEPLQHKFQKVIPKSIGSAIRAFKAAVTNWCRNSGITNFRWQRNFHDRIIRSDSELNRIRTYIAQNPFLWEDDVENPRNASHIAACEQYYGKIFGSGV